MKVKNDFCSKLFLGPILTMAAGLLLTFGLILVGSVVCQQTEVEAKAKAKVITVKKIDQKTAKKVHQQLLKGKAFTIRFKGGEKSFYKKFQKLTKKVAKQTDVGFDVFPICAQDSGYYGHAGFDKQDNKPKKSGKYTKFLVKKAYCEEYIYGIKFAERRFDEYKKYIDNIVNEAEYSYAWLTSDTTKVHAQDRLGAERLAEYARYIQDAPTISLELQRYLRETKFRDLSGTMKARILLEIGDTETSPWTKASISRTSTGRRISFKDLYARKAYGRALYVAHAICKMCAVYDIGEFECIKGPTNYRRVAVRVKMKTRSGKVQYAIYHDGEIDSSSEYVGCRYEEAFVRYRKRYKNKKKVKKIVKTKQIKQELIEFVAIADQFVGSSGELIGIRVYRANASRDDW